MRIGVLGGTFDPIHFGHLRVAEVAREQLRLDQVLFVLAASPPHKPNMGITPVEERWRMLETACADHPGFLPSRIEVERSGPSYTIDTLRHLIQSGIADEGLFLLLGLDSLVELPTWKNYREILDLAWIVAADREGYTRSKVEKAVMDRTVSLDFPPLGISSTAIRRSLRAGNSIRYLVPDAVRAWIETRNLYRTSTDRDLDMAVGPSATGFTE